MIIQSAQNEWARDRLQSLLNRRGIDSDLEWKWTTTSTMDDVSEELKTHEPAHLIVRVAEKQTQGRGTRGRHWVSPTRALMLSVGLVLNQPIDAYRGVALVIGLELVRMLYSHGRRVQVKWPNDLWYDGGKVGGVLVEHRSSLNGLDYLVVGVGINIAISNAVQLSDQTQRMSAMAWETAEVPLLADAVVGVLTRVVHNFGNKELQTLARDWPSWDAFYGCPVRHLSGLGKWTQGIDRGVTEEGELQLEQGGQIHLFSEGSLRPQETESAESDSFVG